MRSGGAIRDARRLVTLAVAFLFALPAGAQSPSASQPATQPAETLSSARQRLTRTPSKDRTDQDRALLAALDFVLALGSADGKRAAATIDVTGYQPLPAGGNLPERPEKPILPVVIEQQVAARRQTDLSKLTTDDVAVWSQKDTRSTYPAIATWMLPQDYLVLFRALPENAGPRWLTTDGGLVVRTRGERTTILGGTLFAALAEPIEYAPPPSEPKKPAREPQRRRDAEQSQ